MVASREGDHQRGFWRARQLTDQFEIRDGRCPGGRRFMVTMEPMHGITLCDLCSDSDPKDGHALAVDVSWFRPLRVPRGVPGMLYAPMKTDPMARNHPVRFLRIKAADLDGNGRPEPDAPERLP